MINILGKIIENEKMWWNIYQVYLDLFIENEKFFKLDSLFCIIVYKKSFKDFYSGFLNDKR